MAEPRGPKASRYPRSCPRGLKISNNLGTILATERVCVQVGGLLQKRAIVEYSGEVYLLPVHCSIALIFVGIDVLARLDRPFSRVIASGLLSP